MGRICFLVAVLSVGTAVEDSLAASNYIGSHLYVALLGSNHRNPVFPKEFTEGAEVPTIGGHEEFALPDEDSSVGLRVGYESINQKRAGLGLSLTYWHAQFEDISFLYDSDGSQDFIAKYGKPNQDLVFLDLNGVYLPWSSGWQALGVYGQVSLVARRQEYRLDKFTTGDDRSERNDSFRERRGLSMLVLASVLGCVCIWPGEFRCGWRNGGSSVRVSAHP